MNRAKPRRTISRPARARAGYFTGLLVAATGLGLALGFGWGLLLLGAGTAVAFVWLYDVDEPLPPDDDAQGVRFR